MHDVHDVEGYLKLQRRLYHAYEEVLRQDNDDGDCCTSIRLGGRDLKYLADLIKADLYHNQQEAHKIATMTYRRGTTDTLLMRIWDVLSNDDETDDG